MAAASETPTPAGSKYRIKSVKRVSEVTAKLAGNDLSDVDAYFGKLGGAMAAAYTPASDDVAGARKGQKAKTLAARRNQTRFVTSFESTNQEVPKLLA